MRDVRSAPTPKTGDASTVYTAEEIRIQQYKKQQSSPSGWSPRRKKTEAATLLTI